MKPDSGPKGIGRRGLLVGGFGGLAAGGLVSGLSVDAAHREREASAGSKIAQSHYEFYDQPHPVGVSTIPQQYSVFMAFDLTLATAQDLQVLLARWSAAIDQLMQGNSIGQVEPEHEQSVATDTGEALGLGPNNLTVTVGFGPGMFDGRFGLAAKRPKKLAKLPKFSSDRLDPAVCDGDISLQACADDPQVAYHAIRDLARMARGSATTKWTVMGFGKASAQGGQETPRNLLGYKDGTRNVSTDPDHEKFVWVGDDDVAWMRGGTYQISRKIQMFIEIWDADRVSDQNEVFGRFKVSGAPLSGHAEFDTPDFHAKGADGDPVIPVNSHVALSAPENNGGVKILRRPYNYTDGINSDGQLDAGLHFLAYVNDPQHFITLQDRLGASDMLNEYIAHRGSAIFAVPPNPARGSFIGRELFG
ncbi:Dyp-type peroxidase [Brevibacterium sp. 5221]|uniref:Dyp-type peroxidase n=1 Tax=Brevibacterium rongguiense TaxID=2695267 RepID=A0A6N9H5J2_9MICO|nr:MULTISPECIES: Dyp-type peroxidase [Brevibacterium]MYM19338.1 Dyp-type peroxidase [Brevibacterium rongguiense]WAL39480.1 Dyp-type peroxidase [Brevibacterium sp. BRM-1]